MFCCLQLNATMSKPQAVSSPGFASDYAFTVAFGAANSTNRTVDQTDTAKFWYDEDPGDYLLHCFCQRNLQ